MDLKENLLQPQNQIPLDDNSSQEKEVRRRIDAIKGNIQQNAKYNLHKVKIEPLQGFELICSTIANTLFCLLLPLWICASIKIVGQRTVMLITSFGKVVDVRDQPGCIWYPKTCCHEFNVVSTQIATMQLRGSSVPDANGSPMNVSAILNYRVTDAVAFTYSVNNPASFIQNQNRSILHKMAKNHI